MTETLTKVLPETFTEALTEILGAGAWRIWLLNIASLGRGLEHRALDDVVLGDGVYGSEGLTVKCLPYPS